MPRLISHSDDYLKITSFTSMVHHRKYPFLTVDIDLSVKVTFDPDNWADFDLLVRVT